MEVQTSSQHIKDNHLHNGAKKDQWTQDSKVHDQVYLQHNNTAIQHILAILRIIHLHCKTVPVLGVDINLNLTSGWCHLKRSQVNLEQLVFPASIFIHRSSVHQQNTPQARNKIMGNIPLEELFHSSQWLRIPRVLSWIPSRIQAQHQEHLVL